MKAYVVSTGRRDLDRHGKVVGTVIATVRITNFKGADRALQEFRARAGGGIQNPALVRARKLKRGYNAGGGGRERALREAEAG